MNQRIRELLARISSLEDELQAALHLQQQKEIYRIEGTKVRFEKAVERAHHQLKLGHFR